MRISACSCVDLPVCAYFGVFWHVFSSGGVAGSGLLLLRTKSLGQAVSVSGVLSASLVFRSWGSGLGFR